MPNDDRHPSRGKIPPGTRDTEAPGASRGEIPPGTRGMEAPGEGDQRTEPHMPDDDRHPSRGEIPPGTRDTEAPGAPRGEIPPGARGTEARGAATDDGRHPSRGEIPPGTRGTEAPGATTEGTCTRACGQDATRTDPELWSRDSARTSVLRGTEKGERPPSAGRIHRGRGEKGRRQAHGNEPSRDVAQGNAHGNEPSRDIARGNQPARRGERQGKGASG